MNNSSVNSGTAVKLGGANVTYAWKNMTRTNSVAGKYDIAEATFAGFESPTITVTGTIPIDLSITNHMTQTMLVNFATCKVGDTTLKVTAGKTGGTILSGRPTAGYETDGAQTLDTNGIKVQIVSFTINFSASETLEGEGWNYSITMVETI